LPCIVKLDANARSLIILKVWK